jgi:branched-chain amino acid transport system ATP-binding protein
VITGLLPATSGRVAIDSTDLSGQPAHKVARAGIARTFQSVRLFRGLTVSENVVVAGIAGGASRADARTRAGDQLAEFGLERHADTLAGTLPYGLERKLELARALATRPTFLLLDEPAAGLDEGESDTLLELLAGIPAKHGCGVVVVDHDMRLIMRLCDRLHVLASGKTIAHGSAEEVRRDPRVIAAYLGSHEAAV